MTGLSLRPYRAGDAPSPGSIPFGAIVLTRDKEQIIRRCPASALGTTQATIQAAVAGDRRA